VRKLPGPRDDLQRRDHRPNRDGNGLKSESMDLEMEWNMERDGKNVDQR
jgi:hypothetical protein